MRKAIAFIMVFAVFCCSVLTAASGVETAMEGVHDGIFSAVVSNLAKPQIALQGVTVIPVDSLLPRMISFVRSDVSTYADSFAFFGNDATYRATGSSVVQLFQLFSTEELRRQLESRNLKAGDVILDGSVRMVDGKESSVRFFPFIDWEAIDSRYEMSIMVTGAKCQNGFIIECELAVRGSRGRTVTITAENLKVNNEIMETEPVVLVFSH